MTLPKFYSKLASNEVRTEEGIRDGLELLDEQPDVQTKEFFEGISNSWDGNNAEMSEWILDGASPSAIRDFATFSQNPRNSLRYFKHLIENFALPRKVALA
jgi:hypothetical protein